MFHGNTERARETIELGETSDKSLLSSLASFENNNNTQLLTPDNQTPTAQSNLLSQHSMAQAPVQALVVFFLAKEGHCQKKKKISEL